MPVHLDPDLEMRNRIIPYDTKLKQLAGKLRKAPTQAEATLWQKIRRKATGYEFHRQVPLSEYIVDFYCHELRLAIEIDGGSHQEEAAVQKDAIRQARLEELGVRFIRFSEKEVRKDVVSVVKRLIEFIEWLGEE